MVILVLVAVAPGAARADGRLTWTGGVSEVEGAGGGGLVPWALIAGVGTADQVGAAAFATGLDTARFSLRVAGVAVGWRDRVEFSYARQRFDIGRIVPGVSLGQDIAGIKLRVAGDAVFDQDRWYPQIAVGAFYKYTRDFDGVPRALGARRSEAVEPYLAATKVLLGAFAGHNVLLDVTLTRSSANQLGLLGFGGPDGAAWRPAATVAVWLTDAVLAGGEYRAKRGALGAPREGDAHDVFVAYAPCKHWTAVVGFVDLGPIAGQGLERGPYLSLVGAF